MNRSKSFMIVGGSFANKGAQAMIFTCVNELRKRFPNCIIHVYSNTDYKQGVDNYKFSILDDSFLSVDFIGRMKYLLSSFIKYCKGDKPDFISIATFCVFKQRYMAAFDISGFALSKKWGKSGVYGYLNRIALIEKNHIPMFIMPQSFEIIDFQDSKIDKLIKDVMRKAKIVFARENQGYVDMKEKYPCANIMESTDIVLQGRIIDYSNVFYSDVKISIPEIESEDNVAVIPNMRNFDGRYGTIKDLYAMYKEIISMLLTLGKNVFLLRHSNEDIEALKKIKSDFADEHRVILLENSFDSYEYESLVTKFKFIIAARYHSIVHAYKHGVPAVVIGWADKYNELADSFNQVQYVIDLRERENRGNVINKIEKMNSNCIVESKYILNKVKEYQEKNCFDIVFNMMDYKDKGRMQ